MVILTGRVNRHSNGLTELDLEPKGREGRVATPNLRPPAFSREYFANFSLRPACYTKSQHPRNTITHRLIQRKQRVFGALGRQSSGVGAVRSQGGLSRRDNA